AVCDEPPSEEQNRTLHKTIKAVTEDLDRMAFNTAISRMMEFTNFFLKQKTRPRAAMEQLVLLLSPWAPHVAEELWQLLGHENTLAYEPWPTYDEALIKEDTVEIVAQIRGKVRGKLRVSAGASQEEVETAARADEKIAQLLAGHEVVKVIVVPGRLINFVTK
ncbi:MAG: class I tRNA ligase family protein, partial [Planctomycetes bacterium]|nr:class I tRNA ligase family protein [Planctomycetota bacterium]